MRADDVEPYGSYREDWEDTISEQRRAMADGMCRDALERAGLPVTVATMMWARSRFTAVLAPVTEA